MSTTGDNAEIARAEDLIGWLRRQSISRRSRSALLHDLQLVTGEREADGETSRLRGLDRDGFVAQLHAPDGGVIAGVPGIGAATLAALRQRIPAPAAQPDQAETGAPHLAGATPEPGAASPKAAAPADALAALSAAADGLLVPSESDVPFTPFRWEGAGELTPEGVLAQLELPPDTEVETRSLEQFFAPLTRLADWMDDGQRATAGRMAELHKRIAEVLDDVVVYRLGRIRITVVIAGKDAAGAVVGLRTALIET